VAGPQDLKESIKRLVPAPLLRRRWTRFYWDEFNGAGERELRLLPDLVRSGARAIDVGGNVGTYSFHLSRLASEVETFEPHPDWAWRIRTLALPNVTVHEVALSDHPGEADLAIPLGDVRDVGGMGSLETSVVDPAKASRVVHVKLRTLDDFGFTNVGFIKIDVEGHEEAVLRGGVQTIARDGPTLLIEIEERHNRGGLARIRELLSGHGYAGYFHRPGLDGLQPLETFDAGRDQAEGGSVYINNFVFRRA